MLLVYICKSRCIHSHNTVNQQMFAVINVCGLANQNISLLLMFAFLSRGELDGNPCFTKMAITPLMIVRFSKFNLVLKLDNESYKCLQIR